MGHRQPRADDLLQHALRRRVEQLTGLRPDLVTADPRAVHRSRIALRRIRSVVTVFGDWFDPTAAADLVAEIRWFAGVLGDVRDPQVQREQLLAGDGDSAADADDPARRAVGDLLRVEEQRGRARLRQVLADERAERLHLLLTSWAEHAPLLPAEQTGGRKALRRAARGARRVVERRLDRAAAAEGDPAVVDELWHDARKAAKRARYAVDAVRPITAKGAARRHRARLVAVQQVLGDHQDAVVAAELLERAAARPRTSRAAAFALGALHEQQRARAAALRHEAASL